MVLNSCPDASSLLIKKSALELGATINCQQKFTEKLLGICSALDCNQLVDSFKNNIQDRTGSVVGE